MPSGLGLSLVVWRARCGLAQQPAVQVPSSKATVVGLGCVFGGACRVFASLLALGALPDNPVLHEEFVARSWARSWGTGEARSWGTGEARSWGTGYMILDGWDV
eukprot:364424-Chlamydomonas_euryale.AAC.6